uniref:UBN2_2 domain-containing protein n=1 Tax=Nicotiana tabacum TaxID=4097 RepID=A0A1S3XGU9_TOBAC|nr:PREDICTED: uncharacterized protein LOC107765008 [Nicotiana tabacum]
MPEPTAQDSDEIKAARKKREDDEVRCRGFILNSLSDYLYDFFHTHKSPQEIWKALEQKFTSLKQGTDRFLGMKFSEFQMVDGKSVMKHVDELLVLISRLKDFKVDVSESLQVGVVLAKLPATWNDYRKKLLHSSEDFNVDQLTTHIRIEKESRKYENKYDAETSSKVN